MGQLSLDGSVQVGPVSSGDNVFPSATSSVNLTSYPNPKPSLVDTGFTTRNVNSPSSFLALSGVGTGDTVTKGDTLYLKCLQKMRVRVTFADTPSDLVSVFIVVGTLVLEADQASNYIKLLEVMGTGPIEYLVSGQL